MVLEAADAWNHVYSHVSGWRVEWGNSDWTDVLDQFPSELLRELSVLEPYSSILQPFCGEGIELVAIACLGFRVRGIDISTKSIERFKLVSRELRVPGVHVREWDLNCDWPDDAGEYDACIISVGSLCWVSNLGHFFHQIAKRIRAGGRLLIFDMHPISQTVSTNGDRSYPTLKRYPAKGCSARRYVSLAYTGVELPGKVCTHIHGVDSIVSSAVRNGFVLTNFSEFSWTTFRQFPWLELSHSGRWIPGAGFEFVPPLSMFLSFVLS